MLLHFSSARDTGIGIPGWIDRTGCSKSFQQVDASTTRHYGGHWTWAWPICNVFPRMMGGKTLGRERRSRSDISLYNIASAAAATAPPSCRARNRSFPAGGYSSSRINPQNRRIIKHRAEQWGLVVEQAFHGRDAVAIVMQSPPFDVSDPGLAVAGHRRLELAEELRQSPRTSTSHCCSFPLCACG